MSSSVIVAGARTPIGKLLGGLSSFDAADLGGIAIAAALERAAMPAPAVEYVIMGQVLTAGAGQLPARQAANKGGVSMSVASTTVSKVCLSGIQAVILADQFIRTGDFGVIVAGGQESMTKAPHLLTGSRQGTKFGPITMVDHMAVDGLEDAFTAEAMGLLTERVNDDDPMSRESQDAFAAASHQRAAAAWQNGLFDDEVVSVKIPQRKGESIVVSRDESIRPDTTTATLGALRPAFRADGTITAGNASPVSDGACALIIMDKEKAEASGITWLAEIGSHGMVAGPDSSLQSQPANAIALACKREGIKPADLDLVEINEAFAAVALASAAELGIGLDRVNVNGGAIAIGHPIGMSGARILLTLALELKRRGGGIGAAALCGGGGQGDALIIRVPKQDEHA
ncbi:acetyl-CoA C-acyltransferase [Arthrobacter sp. AZCC_0090]|uniref:acetyl-CoA C-acyltransferase n=1 Tax=Arthrobacter sp. AZCC_0090 TaxID=2735881 RepID=UPI00160C0A6B|nr:acetyl-CoA C-acyltransferase [Arthrobacter sp. AZCC_0090]MBB6407137.1 acetyl-CoA C-acetyltransferase [Arthrobacter sp. AZCC_0090]